MKSMVATLTVSVLVSGLHAGLERDTLLDDAGSQCVSLAPAFVVGPADDDRPLAFHAACELGGLADYPAQPRVAGMDPEAGVPRYAAQPETEDVASRPDEVQVGGIGEQLRPVADATPVFGGLTGTASAIDGSRFPVYLALVGTAAAGVDALLPPVELWKDGPLGELREVANAALAAGDEAAYGRLAAEYWELMRVAIERRERRRGLAGAGTR